MWAARLLDGRVIGGLLIAVLCLFVWARFAGLRAEVAELRAALAAKEATLAGYRVAADSRAALARSAVAEAEERRRYAERRIARLRALQTPPGATDCEAAAAALRAYREAGP